MITEDQCEEIVVTAMELLERTGVDILNKEAVAAFEKAGCWIDGNRVRIPSVKTEWALRVAPSRLTLCDRNGKRAMLMETNNVYYGPGFGTEKVIDAMTGEEKKATLADVVNIAKIVDGLKDVDFAMSGAVPTDVDAKAAELFEFEALLNSTTKPIVQNVQNAAQANAIMEMAFAVKGSADKFAHNPFAVLYTDNAEPMSINEQALAVVMAAAGKGFPVVFSNRLVTGLTAPKESAGALVVALANSLAVIVLSQIVREGSPIITGGFFTINDLDNKMLPYGAPEISLLGAGYANVLRYLRVPSFGFAGASDSKISDAQMGLESAFSVLHAGLSGTNMIYGAGIMESGCVSNPYLLVIADEVMGMTRRIMSGVIMDEDRLARGVIDDVQPGGHYLGATHTMYYFKREQFWPQLMNRMRIDDWAVAGSKSLGQRAIDKTKELLSFYSGQPLDAATAAAVKDVANKAAANL